MIEDYTAWRFWFDLLQLVGTIAIGVYVWWDRRKKTTEKRFRDLEKNLDDHASTLQGLVKSDADRDANCKDHNKKTMSLENGLNVLRVDIHHLPSRQELSDLSKHIGALTEKLGHLDGRLTGINRAVDLLNQHHLNGGT